MLKLHRIFFSNPSPAERLFGAIPSASESGNRVLQLRHYHHQQIQQRFHQLRLCSSSIPASFTTTALERDEAAISNELKESSQKHRVSRCGIAKEFRGSNEEFFDQQQQSGHNVFGDDACFIATHNSAYVAGVADGVGGWRRHGIDPSKFASQLMKNCADIVRAGAFVKERPDLIIAKAFNKLKIMHSSPGSSTACVLVVDKRTLYAANLGDSGYLICREGEVIFRSQEQTHYFNAPFQLTILPERFSSPAYKKDTEYIGDRPECTDLQKHELESGDLVLIASDGLWDNVPDDKIAELLKDIEPTEASLQARCNTLAMIARHLSNDQHYESPFTKRAKDHGINALGGKPDDVTIVMFHVS